MGIAEVDQTTFACAFADSVAFYINKGFDLIAARVLAADDISRAFVCRDVEIEHESELDQIEFIRDEMNMTRGEFKHWQFGPQTSIGKRP
jgi:hypothetical protein